jgi:DNA-directed RNA polymerase specialized sigma24 family protein
VDDRDSDRIVELFTAHRADLWPYAVRRLSPEVDPDDVVAEVFAVAWRPLREVPDGPEARPYLFAIARRVVANAERAARRRRALAQCAGDDHSGRLVRPVRDSDPAGQRIAAQLQCTAAMLRCDLDDGNLELDGSQSPVL